MAYALVRSWARLPLCAFTQADACLIDLRRFNTGGGVAQNQRAGTFGTGSGKAAYRPAAHGLPYKGRPLDPKMIK